MYDLFEDVSDRDFVGYNVLILYKKDKADRK